MIRPVDSSSWRVASTTAFNGSQENHFVSTSLHLSFTEYYVPVHPNSQQNQDSQIFYLESYVSVYDSGKWVGDINIIQALSSPNVARTHSICRHAPESESRIEIDTGLVSAESWYDILDPPVEKFVVRAHGSWVARLAASAMLIQTLTLDDLEGVVICPRWWCWSCGTNPIPSTKQNTSTSLDFCPPMASNRAYIY